MKPHRQQIFVFGSNIAGRHGAGSALHALKHHGAKRGIGFGLSGSSFAIPTKDSRLKTLPLEHIMLYVRSFLTYAREHPEMEFNVVAIGCGLAGYKPREIAPMFVGAPANVNLPASFTELL